MELFFILALGFGATLAAYRLLIPFAQRIGFVDHPGGRKIHEESTPLIGGLVMIPVFALLLLTCSLIDQHIALLLPAVTVIFLMGAYDDVRQLNPWIKFIVQILIAFYLTAVASADIHFLGNLFGFGDVYLGFLSWPFSIAALVLFMNALNMMDGLDGLAGGIAAAILGWLAFAAFHTGQTVMGWQILCLFVPLFVFLLFNMRYPGHARASIFLGDAGSLSLAVIIGWFAIRLSQEPISAIAPVSIPWLFAIPVIDTLTLFFIRKLRGSHPFAPDRNHLHHRFLDKGIPPAGTTGFILLATIACGSIGIQGAQIVPAWVLLYGWVVVLGLYIAYSLRPAAERTFD